MKIDETTWSDLNLSVLFPELAAGAGSTLGLDELALLMHSPLDSVQDIEKRRKLITCLSGNEKLREDLRSLFLTLGKLKKARLRAVLRKLSSDGGKLPGGRHVEKDSNLLHIFCLGLGLVSISMIFINPPVGFVLMIAAIFFNAITYFRRKYRIAEYIACFSYIIRCIRLCGKLAGKFKDPGIKPYIDEIESLYKELRSLDRMTFLIFSGRDLTGSLLELPLDYIRLFFHLDLLKFNFLLDGVRKNREKIESLTSKAGYLDAVNSISFYLKKKAGSGAVAEPKFINESVFRAKELYHPLILNPVPYTIDTNKNLLITGSNASGKSTYLRSIGLAVYMSRTITFVHAKECEMGFFDLYTSISIRDDLKEGKSRYMAEIQAVKRIVDAVRAVKAMPRPSQEADGTADLPPGQNAQSPANAFPVVSIVDEVLSGTNTIERIAAGAEIMRYLGKKPNLCIAATHDMPLTQILAKQEFENYHFAEEIKDGNLSFPYKLLPGPAESRDAIRLLEIAGFDKEITDSAFEMAKELENGKA